MEITPASKEQVGMFKAGFAARALELNVPPKTAEAIFDACINKLAEDVGVVAPVGMTPNAEKLAAELRAGLAKPLSPKAEKLASVIRTALSV